MQVWQNTNWQSTNVTKHKCNKIQMEQHTNRTKYEKKQRQAGAELCQAQLKFEAEEAKGWSWGNFKLWSLKLKKIEVEEI